MVLAESACAAEGEIAYICGPENAEDLFRLGNTDWLIASSITTR